MRAHGGSKCAQDRIHEGSLFCIKSRGRAAANRDSGDRPCDDAHDVALTDQTREMQIRVRTLRPGRETTTRPGRGGPRVGGRTSAGRSATDASAAIVKPGASWPAVPHDCATGMQSWVAARQQSASTRPEASGSARKLPTLTVDAEGDRAAAKPVCARWQPAAAPRNHTKAATAIRCRGQRRGWFLAGCMAAFRLA